MEIASRARTVHDLWNRLDLMERELRFQGRPYPPGMREFPFRLTGQGFFPGGDGLWRDDRDLGEAKDGVLPEAGVLLLGNDFGTLRTFNKWRRRGYEIVPTWKHVKSRIDLAGIPTEKAFFTNAIVGLREDGAALDKKSWQSVPEFAEFCGEFLRIQLTVLAPKLVIVMGPDARDAFDAFVIKPHEFRVLYTSHPYGDFGLARDRLKREIDAMAVAWRTC